ncbi:MAG: hypothetical protein V4466_17420 [Pseudomonadota bacterium]
MRVVLLTLPVLALLAACSQAPKGIDIDRLDQSVGGAIGDPSTCVLLVERGTAQVVYRFGTHANCGRRLPSCKGPGAINVDDLGKLAAAGDERTISCDSGPGGVNRVGWASGPAPSSPGTAHGDLTYAAMMEGPSVLPGREIKIRLEAALTKAGM